MITESQPKEVIQLFTILYIILNEKYSDISSNTLINNFMSNVIKKYNENSINSLFLNVLPTKTNLSTDQIKAISKIKEDNDLDILYLFFMYSYLINFFICS